MTLSGLETEPTPVSFTPAAGHDREVTRNGLRAYFDSITSARLAVAEASAYFDGLEPFGEMAPTEFSRHGEELRKILVAQLALRRRFPRTEVSR